MTRQLALAGYYGHAFGGGLELLLACDFFYAARTARFALTEVTLGLSSPTVSTSITVFWRFHRNKQLARLVPAQAKVSGLPWQRSSPFWQTKPGSGA
jgi:enoyl-CoA hydratase/carnithine racemase